MYSPVSSIISSQQKMDIDEGNCSISPSRQSPGPTSIFTNQQSPNRDIRFGGVSKGQLQNTIYIYQQVTQQNKQPCCR